MASLLCPHCKKSLEVQQVPPAGTLVRCFLCNTPFTIEGVAKNVAKPGAKPMPVAKPLPPKTTPVAEKTQQPAVGQGPLQPIPPAPWNSVPLPPLGPADFNNAGGNYPGYLAHPVQDQTPTWVPLLTIAVGGAGAIILVLVIVLSVFRPGTAPAPTSDPNLHVPLAAAPTVPSPVSSVSSGNIPAPSNTIPTTPKPAIPASPPVTLTADSETIVSQRPDLHGKLISHTGVTIRDEAFDIQSTRGKLVIVQVFASWSAPCRGLIPQVKELHTKYSSYGLEVIGISLDADRVTLTNFTNANPLPWKILFGPANQQLASSLSLTAPSLVVLNKEGKVLAVTANTQNFVALIESELDVANKKPPVQALTPPTTIASNTPKDPAPPETTSTAPMPDTPAVAANNSPADPNDFFGGAPPEKFDESQPKSSESEETPIAAPSVSAPAGVRYGWQRNRQYPYNFRFRIDQGRGNATQEIGRVLYTANAAETKLIQDLLKLKGEGEATGTGFVVHSDGLIATCDHVIRGATKIEVTVNKKKYFAKVVARDPKNDLALIRIDAKNLPTLPLGDSETLRLLEDVYAMGYPLSSALGTNIKATPGTIAGLPADDSNVIQLNAGINPGNSGGPVVNGKGEVIGVCSAKLVGTEISNVGFAVPVNLVKALLTKKKYLANGTEISSVKMDAPTVAESTTPATAYLRVTIGAEVENVMVLNFSGQTNQASFASGAVLVTMSGESIIAKDDRRLPGLMGSFGTLVIEKLPEEGEKTWETSSVSSLGLPTTIGSGSSTRIVLNEVPIHEKISYRISSKQGDSLIINKKMEIVMMGKTKKVIASGNGTITFDLKLGFPKKCAMQSWYNTSPGTGDQKTSVSYVYEYAGSADLPSVNGPRRPLSPVGPQTAGSLLPRPIPGSVATEDMLGDVRTILERLRDPQLSSLDYHNVLTQLARIPPISEQRDEVSRELDKFLVSKDSLVRTAAFSALKKWGSEHNIPTLLKLLETLDDSTRRDSILCLGLLSKKTEIAEKLAPLLGDTDHSAAEEALKAMGPIAEDAVLAQLAAAQAEEFRSRAIEVLEDIGTKKSIAPLQAIARNRSNTSLQYRAEAALRKITERLNAKR